MKESVWSRYIRIALGLTILIVSWLAFRILSPKPEDLRTKPQAQVGGALASATPSPSPTPLAKSSDDIKDPILTAGVAFRPKALQTLQKCFEKSPSTQRWQNLRPKRFDDLAQTLSSESENPPQILFENLHIKLHGSGDILRIHDPGTGPIKAFGVDREDLPVARELPESLKGQNRTEIMRRARNDLGEVLYRERRYNLNLRENVGVEIFEINGEVVEIHIKGPGVELGCSYKTKDQCTCL